MELEATGERYISDDLWGCRSENEHRHRYCSVKELVRGKKVLDSACGSGYGSFYLAQFAESVVGIDIAPDAIKFCKETYHADNLVYDVMSAEKLDFVEHFFDVVISFETIEHLTATQQKNFLKQIKKVLKKDGVLVMSTPDKYISTEIVNNNQENIYHLHEFTTDEYELFLKGYFKNTILYYQNIVEMSLLSNEKEIDGRYPVYTSSHFTSSKPSKYVVAVCSDENLNGVDLRGVYVPNVLQYYNETFKVVKKGCLYRDLGRKFIEDDKISEEMYFTNDLFKITFTLSSDNVKALRFDPCEYACRISDLRVCAAVQFKLIPQNAAFSKDGEDVFMNMDPIYILKANEDISNVNIIEIQGRLKKVPVHEMVQYYVEESMKVKAEVELLRGKNYLAEEKYKELQKQLEQTRNDVETMEKSASRLEELTIEKNNKIQQLNQVIEDTETALQSVLQSNSWRMTKPVRMFVETLKSYFEG